MGPSLILLIVVLAVGTYFALRATRTGPFAWIPNEVSGDAMADKQARLVMFYVDWCPFCKKAKPIWQGIHERHDGTTVNGYTLSVESVNCESDKAQAKQYGIDAYPTFKLIRKDKIFGYKGPIRKDTLEQFLQDSTKA